MGNYMVITCLKYFNTNFHIIEHELNINKLFAE